MATAKQRSPNYPTITAGEAIELVKKLYHREKRGSFPSEIVASAWGYKSFSGPVRSKLSALKQYGLIDQKKGGQARLSDRALTIVLRNPASREYAEALKEAALEPPLFREFYETRLDSSDDTLMHDLIVNRKFTDEGAKQFIEGFREAMALAGLTEPDKISGKEAEEEEDIGKMFPPPPGTTERVIPLPLSATKWMNLKGPFPLSEAEWKLMLAILQAMKPGLVSEDSQRIQRKGEENSEKPFNE